MIVVSCLWQAHDPRVAAAKKEVIGSTIFLHDEGGRDISTGGADGPRFNVGA